ncbi:importin-4-like [Lineus longissimus]|uniref:importin-4-like n=1 Tax=Lineus longissimus TaxID=88925 RepID=UPI002B4D99A1
MASNLESVLANLLVPDNAVIQQATLTLKELSKDPSIVPALCNVLHTSQDPQVRQYAAVLLRRRIQKSKQWQGLPAVISESIRASLIQVLISEQEKDVKNAIGQIVGVVAKHELPKQGGWPELFSFLEASTTSQDSKEREIGMYVLSIISGVATDQLKPHILSFCQLFNKGLVDMENRMIPFYTIVCMTNLVCEIGTDEANKFQVMVPKVLDVIRALITVDEEQAREALEIFDELVECDVSIVVPHIKAIVEFCLQIASNKDLSDSLRVKALTFISWLTRLKKKSILKHKLIQPILDVCFPLMCSASDGDDDDDDDDDSEQGAESSRPNSVAGQVIDTMALHLPPTQLIPKLMLLVEPSLMSDDPLKLKGGFLAIAVIAEGCADNLRNKYLKALLQCVGKGIQHSNPMVKHAALFALGQFSEYLQPEISKFAADILPLLFTYLNEIMQNAHVDRTAVSKTYYALEMFCENLGKDILPYLPTLMERLLTALHTSPSNRVKELSISAIAATANAAKEEMVPYFQSIIEQLKVFLMAGNTEENMELQIQAIDTLGVLARTIGANNFMPLAHECVTLGLKLMTDVDDPDLRRCVYGLMAAISTLLKADMAQYLPTIVEAMITSIRSTEGVKLHIGAEEEAFKLFDEEDITQENGEEEEKEVDDVQGFSVENSYLDEKEDACCSLGEIAMSVGLVFMPHMELCFKEVVPLLEHPGTDVRKGAVTALGHFCCCLGAAALEGNQEVLQGLLMMLSTVIPKFIELVRKDSDRHVSMTVLEELKDMLEKVKGPVLQGENHLQMVAACLKDVLLQKTACQDDDEDIELGQDQAEYDMMLIQYAGDVIPALGSVIGGKDFAPYFTEYLPEILKRLKKDSSIPERSFAIGTIAEAIESLGPASEAFAPKLYPIIIAAMKDEDEEVRSNAIFACGVLAANGGQVMLPHYEEILKHLFHVLQREHNPRVLDNICAAVCRMIMANMQVVPIDQVFPTVLQCLPLKEDDEENVTVFRCIGQLYEANHDQVVKNLPQLLKIISSILGTELVSSEAQTLIIHLVHTVHQRSPEVLESVLASLPEDQAHKLRTCLSCSTL